MRGSPIIYDGLWRCLCPAFDKLGLRQAVMAGYGLKARRSMPRDVARRTAPSRGISHFRVPGRRPMTTLASPEPPTTEWRNSTPSTPASGQPPHDSLLRPTPPTEDMMRQASVADILAALRLMRQLEGWNCHGHQIDRYDRILLLVRHLLLERLHPPTFLIYECLMDAMIDPQGSVKGIRMLLDELAARDMKPSSPICHSALAALSIHPDYVLRQQVLDTMQEQWFTIGQDAKQSLVLGLLRDEQYELAYLRLSEMVDQNEAIDSWVYDIFIVVFGQLGYFDELLLLLYRRKSFVDEDKDVASLLYYTLDMCSRAFHYRGTVFAWNAIVRTSLLQPSDGVVENVLATAARHGDTALATEALDKISRRTRLLAHHFEAVAEAFAANNDMDGAFHALCVMQKNGIPIVQANTRGVYEALRRSPELIHTAEESIRSLVSSEQQVPVVAVGVVVELIAETQGTEAALNLYDDIPELCGEPASSTTIQTLIVRSRHMETTRALVKDYAALVAAGGDEGPVRSPHVYSSLIIACVEADDLDLAFRFAFEAIKTMGRGGNEEAYEKSDLSWAKVLLQKAGEVEDARIWTVVDRLREQEGMEDEVVKILRQARLRRRAADLGAK
ncbi:hypothetical protein E4U28_001062 [Claviceps purpurea]|nr:hypothetical protein E4U28_001062 [Claviceps purpurea]